MGRNAMYHSPRASQEFARAGTPLQPNYMDEMTEEHAAAIRKAVDPEGRRAEQRRPLYNPGW